MIESDNKSDLTEKERNAESSKHRWWIPLWLMAAILMFSGENI